MHLCFARSIRTSHIHNKNKFEELNVSNSRRCFICQHQYYQTIVMLYFVAYIQTPGRAR